MTCKYCGVAIYRINPSETGQFGPTNDGVETELWSDFTRQDPVLRCEVAPRIQGLTALWGIHQPTDYSTADILETLRFIQSDLRP
jgi:hypothetical protein